MMQMNASLQQMATHGAQLQQQQQAIMQQMAMLTMNQQPHWQRTLATPAPLTIPQAFPGTTAPPVPHYQTYMQPMQQPHPYGKQQQYPQYQQFNQNQRGGGYGSCLGTRGRGRGCTGGYGRGYNNGNNGRGGRYSGYNNVPMPYVGGHQMVQYTQTGVPSVLNPVNQFANQNACSCADSTLKMDTPVQHASLKGQATKLDSIGRATSSMNRRDISSAGRQCIIQCIPACDG